VNKGEPIHRLHYQIRENKLRLEFGDRRQCRVSIAVLGTFDPNSLQQPVQKHTHVLIVINDNLHHIRVHHARYGFNRFPRCSYPCILISNQRLNGIVDRQWRNQRLVALHIHNDVDVSQRRRNFRDPIRSATVIDASNHRFIPVRPHCLEYSLIISRHNRATNISRRERSLNNPANHGFSGDFQ